MSPDHVPSPSQFSGGRVNTGGQGMGPSNVGGLRRMTSTPALMATQAASTFGNGPFHVPTRPAATSQALTVQAIGGGPVPAHAKTAQFLRCM